MKRDSHCSVLGLFVSLLQSIVSPHRIAQWATVGLYRRRVGLLVTDAFYGHSAIRADSHT